VLLGFHTRLEAGLLIIFQVPVTLVIHNFWSVSDPMTLQIEVGPARDRCGLAASCPPFCAAGIIRVPVWSSCCEAQSKGIPREDEQTAASLMASGTSVYTQGKERLAVTDESLAQS
jgi:hypothetical protein